MNTVMYSADEQVMIREDIFRWLDNQIGSGINELTRTQLINYHFGDVRIPLLDSARGIRNPQNFDATLSIMTSVNGPYEDLIGGDGLVHYRYQSRDGGDNVKLRRALDLQTPLVYFQGIRPGVFVPIYPVFVIADDSENRSFAIALDESMRFFGDPLNMAGDQRRYAERTVLQRLHQPVFRARVMHAYDRACTVCRLKHPDLLDAAHIQPDSSVGGIATVTNGLALCKIHHAAYDRNLMGISPDYGVHINRDLLEEVDGPMLRHGLQDMHGVIITLPRRRQERPSREALALRFDEFVA